VHIVLPVIRLGIDFGTSNTVAVLDVPGRPARPLLLDGSPQLPSAVFADPGGSMITGRDALHHARRWPERLAPHPKRHIDEQTVLLGDVEPTVASLIGAVLRRVRDEATRVAGGAVTDVVITHPASWGSRRRGVITAAAAQAGLPTPTLVTEPVAAATCFPAGDRVGSCVVVYDFGAGTFDASVVRRTAAGFDVLAYTGLADSGGLDIDAVVVAHLLAGNPEWDDAVRDRLDRPRTAADRRARMLFWDDVRSAKEVLSRNASTFVHVPLLDTDVPLTRAQFERLARPVLDRTVAATRAAIRDAAVPTDDIAGIFLVGGSSRIPLCATLLHQTFGIAPTVVEQPELVVAQGALRAPTAGRPAPVVSRPAPVRSPPAPVTARSAPVASPRAPVTGGPAPVMNRPAPLPPAAPPGGDRRPRRGARPAVAAALAIVVLVVVAGVAYAVKSWSDRRAPDDSAKGPSASTTSSGAATFPASVAGDWQGSTLQSDGKRHALRMTLDADTAAGTVTYPDLRCSGTLELTRIAGSAFTVRETITSGGCTPTGTITLTVSSSGLSLQYQPDDNKYTATGYLNRP
jgi:Ethanolamine utilization protein EutJ (predicted chaperonin)